MIEESDDDDHHDEHEPITDSAANNEQITYSAAEIPNVTKSPIKRQASPSNSPVNPKYPKTLTGTFESMENTEPYTTLVLV